MKSATKVTEKNGARIEDEFDHRCWFTLGIDGALDEARIPHPTKKDTTLVIRKAGSFGIEAVVVVESEA